MEDVPAPWISIFESASSWKQPKSLDIHGYRISYCRIQTRTFWLYKLYTYQRFESYRKFFFTSVSISFHIFLLPWNSWVKHQVDHRIRIIIGHLQHWSVFPPAQWTYLEAISDLLIFVIFWNLLRHAIGIRWFQHPCLWSLTSMPVEFHEFFTCLINRVVGLA